LTQIERDLSQVTEAIDAIVAADNELRVRADILMSIPPSRTFKHVLPGSGTLQR